MSRSSFTLPRSNLLKLVWLVAAAARLLAAAASDADAAAAAGDGSSSYCDACLVFELLTPPAELAYPPLTQFFANYEDHICSDAYGNLTAHLDSPLLAAANSGGLVPGDVGTAGFANGDHSCSSGAIKWCARFHSREAATGVQDIVREGAAQFMTSFLCPSVPGSYGFRARSESAEDCFQLNVDAVCRQPPRVRFPNGKCNRTQATTPLRLAPFATVEPGRRSWTRLHCFEIIGRPADRNSRCTSRQLTKVEIWADDKKRRLVKGARITKNRGRPVWGAITWGAPGDNALKITPLNWTMSDAMGGKVCIEVLDEVDALSDVCLGDDGLCYIALFNERRDCCPTYPSAAAPSPPPPDYYTTFP